MAVDRTRRHRDRDGLGDNGNGGATTTSGRTVTNTLSSDFRRSARLATPLASTTCGGTIGRKLEKSWNGTSWLIETTCGRDEEA
jgi:hypothetical protein